MPPSLFVKNFSIHHFKKIRDTSFECGPINIFTGANNSGKSSILTAIHFFYSIWQATITKGSKDGLMIEASGSGKENFPFSTSITERNLLFLPTRNLEDIAYSELKHTSQSEVDVIKIHANDESIGIRVSHNTNRQSFSLNLTHKNFNDINQEDATEFLSIYTPGLSGIPFEEIHYGSKYVQNQAAYFGTAGSVLRNILWRIWQDEQKRLAFLKDIYTIYEHERDITILGIIGPQDDKNNPENRFKNLPRDAEFNEFLEFKVRISYNSISGQSTQKEIPLSQMGAGFLQVMHILAYKHLYNPKVMLLDEPEIHLHGTLIKKLFKVLERWVENNSMQIFVSTHSQAILHNLLAENTHKDLYRLFNIQNGNAIPLDITEDNITNILTDDLGESLAEEIKKVKQDIEKEHFDILLLSEDSTPLVDRLIPPHLKQQIRVIPGNGADINSLSARVESFRQEFPHKKILVHVDKDKQAKYINSKLNIWFLVNKS